MFDGIIFDVDGTLWDSTGVVEDAWNQAFIDCGFENHTVTADRLKSLFGLPMKDIIDALIPEESEDRKLVFMEKCFEYEESYLRRCGGAVYKGLEETVKALSEKYPLAIVSNCQAGYIELFLEKTGLSEYFKDHLCPGDTKLLKADNIKLICERNNMKNAIYVGDTQMDANACKDAGVPIVYCRYGFGKVEEPDYTIDEMSELIGLFI